LVEQMQTAHECVQKLSVLSSPGSSQSAWCRVQAWAVIEQYAAPVLRAVPFLGVPIGFVRRWFMPPGA